MKPVQFHPAARTEFILAAEYYERKQKGLGRRLLLAVEAAALRVRHHPHLYRKIEGAMRKCRVAHFPFGLIFREGDDAIEIVAVMDLRRRPGYWRERVPRQ